MGWDPFAPFKAVAKAIGAVATAAVQPAHVIAGALAQSGKDLRKGDVGSALTDLTKGAARSAEAYGALAVNTIPVLGATGLGGHMETAALFHYGGEPANVQDAFSAMQQANGVTTAIGAAGLSAAGGAQLGGIASGLAGMGSTPPSPTPPPPTPPPPTPPPSATSTPPPANTGTLGQHVKYWVRKTVGPEPIPAPPWET